MVRKIIFILLFPLVSDLIISCCCNCNVPEIAFYTNKTLGLENIDNSGSSLIISTATSFNKNAYGIRVHLGRERTVQLYRPKTLFLSSAYANGCRCPSQFDFTPRDSITAIRILTENDFDNSHPANSEISDYFKVYDSFVFQTLGEYLQKTETTINAEVLPGVDFDILLMTAPTLNINHRFKVQLVLSDGRTLEQETTQIELL